MSLGPRVAPDPPPRLGRGTLMVIVATAAVVALIGLALLVVSVFLLRG